jgi:hypothetical protein
MVLSQLLVLNFFEIFNEVGTENNIQSTAHSAMLGGSDANICPGFLVPKTD